MERDKDGKKFVTLVSTPGGYFTPATAPAKTKPAELDEIVDNLLKDVDVPITRAPDTVVIKE